ncbi:MAG: sugar ABC transporter ATP-binding protein [Acetobacteraceae bacterium]|nr:sugar ABC transporter ATP-binding protein [Acetobacteraceae bacterium]
MLIARNLSKHYGGVHALEGVGLEMRAGEIRGLCGENGAGKSTFIKILGGLVRPDTGEISVSGIPLHLGHRTDPKLVSIVHQELAIVPTLSVLDNILLGSKDTGELYFRSRFRETVRSHLDSMGLSHLSLDTLAGQLSLAERQLVEIARGVSRHANVLLLDEPTATLSDAEIQRVFAICRYLRDQGTALVFVSHRLDEVFALTDSVTVLRNGQHVLTQETSTLRPKELVRAMIGRELVHGHLRPYPAEAAAVPRLRLTKLSIPGKLRDVDLSLARGEIVAVVGTLGSGADAVMDALAGLDDSVEGRIELDGETVAINGVRDAIRKGIAYLAEDRAGKGVFLDAPIGTNLVASVMDRFSKIGVMQQRAERQRAVELASMFIIDARRLPHEVSTLSGGNQQKVSLGKAAALDPRLLLLNEPTRGVDIGARSEIYSTLRRMADQGLSILFYSPDLEEVLDLADRVLTIFRGSVVRFVRRQELTGDDILDDIIRGRSHAHAA